MSDAHLPAMPCQAAAPPRRRSASVSLGLALFVAGTLAACTRSEPRRCVDKDDWVVDDQRCADTTAPRGYPGGFHWYYGGSVAGIGQRVSGGSYAPRPGASYHSTTVRGGFGHSAAAHGSGGQA